MGKFLKVLDFAINANNIKNKGFIVRGKMNETRNNSIKDYMNIID